MPAKESLIGRTFGRLKVIADAPDYVYGAGRKNRMSLCICECGKTKAVRNNALKRGTKSCGCLIREATIRRNFTHGMTHTRINKVWRGMKKRCLNPSDDSFKHYGGRGITVCQRWLTFEQFLEDVGEGKKGWTLERVNNNGNYEPTNICWATCVRQQRNKRSNVIFTVLGKTGCVAELCEHFKIKPGIAWHRIQRGWPPEQVFTKPIQARYLPTAGSL